MCSFQKTLIVQVQFCCKLAGTSQLGDLAISVFSFVQRAPGLLISRSYGRVMPARFA
jgi:hypothetical protein